MANWKKVVVSGSIAELAQISASTGIYIPTNSLHNGHPDNFVLTVDPGGSVEKLDPKLIGSAFQSMSVAGHTGPGILGTTFGHDTFIAQPGLNELFFVSGSNIKITTSQSIRDNHNNTDGFIKISAVTASLRGVTHKTEVSRSDGHLFIHTAQAISTGSNVNFADISGSKLTITSGSNDLAVFESNTNKANIKIKDHDTTVFVSTENGRAAIGSQNTPNAANLNINIDASEEGSIGNVGIGTKYAPEKLTVRGNISASGHISASGDLHVEGDTTMEGDLGIGGVIFSLTGFGVTIDDVAITSGSVNFGSGSLPSDTRHKFTGSISVSGSNLTLVDGIFAGDGTNLTNLDADALFDTHDLTWGYGLTSSNGSAYNVTTSIQLDVHISGSEITSSVDGLFIPGHSLRLDHFRTSSLGQSGGIISYMSGTNAAYEIPIGTLGQVLTVTGDDYAHHTASFKDLPPTIAAGIQTGSVDNDLGNGIALILTSSKAGEMVSRIPISGSDNQITVSGSLNTLTGSRNNTIHLRLADNIKGITSITASAGIQAGKIESRGDITASGNLFVGGDIMVAGDTTLLHTSNLLVEDAFVTLASGSTQTDGGIIVQTDTLTGKGFGWDNTAGRWGLQDNLSFNTTNITPSEFIMSAKITGSNPFVDTDPTYGQAGSVKQSSGQFWINTGSGDIWVYVD